jgi:hypothetical protein
MRDAVPASASPEWLCSAIKPILQHPVRPGKVGWTRLGASLGPVYRIAAGRFSIDLHAELVAAALLLRANSFSADFDPGIGTGIRVSARLGHVAPFVGTSFVGWLRRQLVVLSPSPLAAELPRLDLLFTAGIAFAPN